jgi:altronate hydrolase
MKEFIKINSKDNVVIVLRDYKKDEIIKVDEKEIKILQETMKGHKIALENISKGENILTSNLKIYPSAYVLHKDFEIFLLQLL